MAGRKHFPEPTQHSVTIENRRAWLRQALKKYPDNIHILNTLKIMLQPPNIRRAAKRGVYVCYSRPDEIFALELNTDLKKVGVPAWMDEVEMSLESDWGKMVGNALHGCGVLVLVLSPGALNDIVVRGECIYFLNKGKVVIPVLSASCDIDELDLLIPPIRFYDNYDKGLQQLLPLLINPSKASA